MNILICNNRYFPSSGPERNLFALTTLFERHGHKVVPMSVNYAQTIDTPYRRYFIPPPVDGESVFYRQYKDKVTIKQRFDLFARAAYSRTARQMAERIIREQQIDIVYLLNTVNVLSPSIIDAAHSQGIPAVLFLCDFNLLCPAYAFLRDGHVCQECLGGYHHALQHRCLQGSLAVTSARVLAMSLHHLLGIYNRASGFIAPSRFMAQEMEHFKPAQGRIYHIPNFVDEEMLDRADSWANAVNDTQEPGSERPYMLFFGRVAPDKGVEPLIRAFAGLERDVDLVIAGESGDDYRQRMMQLAGSLGANRVRFPGFVNGDALSALIAGAQCVVAPSVWHDNAPLSVYESMAYGKAIVGSDLGGISEQLADGCGLLVEGGNVEALRAALQQVADDSTLRERLGQAARKRAREEYAPELHYERVMSVFEQALATQSRQQHHH